MIIHLITAARPNFMKIAPLYHALNRVDWATPLIVHTGQHYDINMSDAFFTDLGLPEPDFHLGVGSGSHGKQTGEVIINYERILLESRPDLVIVVGDVNSTVAATLTAVKLGIKVAHLEAGLRSFDRTMPEEINRLVTDSIADLLWTPSPDADENLAREGVATDRVERVGNIMIDSLEMMRGKIQDQAVYEEFGLTAGEYGIVTIHRPFNVDNGENLETLCRSFSRIAERMPLLFPAHPRTLKSLETHGLLDHLGPDNGTTLVEPLSYIRFMNLVFNCRMVITDSGGIQEETTYLGIPCLTIRPNTERPITISEGTNRLCEIADLEGNVERVLDGSVSTRHSIELWDGRTAERVVRSIEARL